jgi:PadR family transcriptional regulator, regulatory protein PadR
MPMRISHQMKRVLQAFLDAPTEETYGFALSQVTGLRAGTLYPVLRRLLDEGWLSERWEEINESVEGRRRRRYYRLTGLGESRACALVEEETAGLRQLMPGWAQ